MVVASVANEKCLHFQGIFQGIINRSLPKLEGGRYNCEHAGWNLTFSHNHWSTLDTFKKFVEKILLPYKDSQVELLNLPAMQKMIWLIDYWSVHINKEFGELIKNHHPKSHILYIPTNCTNIYQPANVIIQQPFKHAFRQTLNKYTMEAITKQLKIGENVHMDFKISKLKPYICEWLYVVWTNVSSRITTVFKDLEQTGLLRTFDKEFQKQAMLDNIKISLFKTIEEKVQAYNT